MNNESNLLTRRDAFLGTLTASVLTLVEMTASAEAGKASSASTSELIADNDYPYFDFVPQDSLLLKE